MRTLSATPFFSLLPFLFIYLFSWITCAIFLCNKKAIGYHARSRAKDHRISSTIRLPVTRNSHVEKERTVFLHFQRFQHSLSFLFLLCVKFPPLFPNYAFPKRPFFSRARFPARKSAIIFCCQLRVIMRSTDAILRNHQKKNNNNRGYSYAVNAQILNLNYFKMNSRNLREPYGIASKAMNS